MGRVSQRYQLGAIGVVGALSFLSACATQTAARDEGGGAAVEFDEEVAGADEADPAAPVPEAVAAQRDVLCAEQIEKSREQFDAIFGMVSGNLRDNGHSIKISVVEVRNTDCTATARGGSFDVDVFQEMQIAVNEEGAIGEGSAELSVCYTLESEGDGWSVRDCNNSHVLDNDNVERVEISVNESIPQSKRLQIDLR